MKSFKKDSLIVLLLALNIVFSLFGSIVLIYNTNAINKNQLIFDSKIEALTTYIGDVEGEILETSETIVDLDFHFQVWVYDENGYLKQYEHHAGTLTDLGADWIQEHLGSNSTRNLGLYTSLSNSASAPSTAWVVLPVELTTLNMSRRLGVFTDTGTGTYDVDVEWNPTGSGAFQLGGLNFRRVNNGLICADQTTSVSFTATDTIFTKWSVTIT